MSGAFSTLNELVQSFEDASGNPAALNQSGTSTASGLYQFTNPTWTTYASQIGVNTGLYPTAASAPPSVQNQVFAQAVAQNGLNDWTCAGCDAPLTAYLNANPTAASLPVAGQTGVPQTGPGGTAQGTAPSGSSCGTGYNPANWFCYLGQFAGAVVGRVSVFLLALVLIAGGIAIYGARTIGDG